MRLALLWLLLVTAGIFILVHSIIRDIRYTKEYPADLRYRVVGARLVKDGKLPYFYKWKKGDGFRYYDPDNFDNEKPSNITVSPFYLHLLSPIADLPEADIAKGWLVSEYGILVVLTVFCFLQAKTTAQKVTVVLFALLFLLTNAWKCHIDYGQSYLWMPFFAFLFYVCFRRNDHFAWGFAAGTVAACFVLVRLNTLFFFLPFLFLLPRYKRSWWLAFCLPPLLLGAWTLLDKQERNLWLDYKALLGEQLKVHQDLGFEVQHNDPNPKFAYWEGIDKREADRLGAAERDTIYTENGNVFVLFRLLFKRRLSPALLGIAGIAVITGLLLCFYFLQRPFQKLPPAQLTIFAFCCYMVSDLFSPFYRHQFYTVQWLFILLLAAATWGRGWRTATAILLAGLVLNCVHLPFIKMGNTIGEYGILAVLLVVSLVSGRPTGQKPQPDSISID